MISDSEASATASITPILSRSSLANVIRGDNLTRPHRAARSATRGERRQLPERRVAKRKDSGERLANTHRSAGARKIATDRRSTRRGRTETSPAKSALFEGLNCSYMNTSPGARRRRRCVDIKTGGFERIRSAARRLSGWPGCGERSLLNSIAQEANTRQRGLGTRDSVRVGGTSTTSADRAPHPAHRSAQQREGDARTRDRLPDSSRSTWRCVD